MVKVVINPEAIDAAANGPGMETILKLKGEAVKQQAIDNAPDHPAIGKGYIASFEVHVGKVNGDLVCRVINTDFKAWWVEHGAMAGGRTHVLNYRVLGNALRSLGGG